MIPETLVSLVEFGPDVGAKTPGCQPPWTNHEEYTTRRVHRDDRDYIKDRMEADGWTLVQETTTAPSQRLLTFRREIGS